MDEKGDHILNLLEVQKLNYKPLLLQKMKEVFLNFNRIAAFIYFLHLNTLKKHWLCLNLIVIQ